MPVPTSGDPAPATRAERTGAGSGAPPRGRRLVLAVTIGGAALMFPWIAVLSATLPSSQPGGAWRAAWVGFDLALAVVLAVTGAQVWRRRDSAPQWLAVSASLVITDAWFDVCLSWGSTSQGTALISAVLVELPVAALLVWAATSRTSVGIGRTASAPVRQGAVVASSSAQPDARAQQADQEPGR